MPNSSADTLKDDSSIVLHSAPLIRDQVYQVILKDILTGRLQGGDRVTERALAARMGISTTPVKEALRRLENEGFVHAIPRRGVVVTDNALTSIADLFTVRSALDSLAARLTATRIASGELGPDECRALNKIAKEIRLLQEQQAVEEATELFADFHDQIRKLSGNRFIVQFLGLWTDIERALRPQVLSDANELRLGIEEHLAVHEAISAGQGRLAEQLMRDHIVRSGHDSVRVAPEWGNPSELNSHLLQQDVQDNK